MINVNLRANPIQSTVVSCCYRLDAVVW